MPSKYGFQNEDDRLREQEKQRQEVEAKKRAEQEARDAAEKIFKEKASRLWPVTHRINALVLDILNDYCSARLEYYLDSPGGRFGISTWDHEYGSDFSGYPKPSPFLESRNPAHHPVKYYLVFDVVTRSWMINYYQPGERSVGTTQLAVTLGMGWSSQDTDKESPILVVSYRRTVYITKEFLDVLEHHTGIPARSAFRHKFT